MKRPLTIAALAMSIATVAAAQSNYVYPCTNGNGARRVEIAYEGSTGLPCEVRYFKDNNSTPQVLWRATTETGYCEAQAREFVAKLQGMGWICTDSGTRTSQAAAPAAAPREADDTGVLGAGSARD